MTMKTVSQIFSERLYGLIKDTDGAALALTLAFLAPVYFFAVALFAVVETAHHKIELQNAADAAAYSAATVQADYLSRIATINKCLAWTYGDLIRRQMDLAQASFADTVMAKFESDQSHVVSYHNKGCSRAHCSVPGVNYNAGTSPEILKDMWPVTLAAGGSAGVPQLLEGFNDQSFFKRFSVYIAVELALAEAKGKGIVGNTPKVISHVATITDANSALEKIIDQGEMKNAMLRAATNVIELNTREVDDRIYRYVEIGEPEKYFRTLGGDVAGLVEAEADEQTLLEMGFYLDNENEYKPKEFFGKGADYWYCRSPLPIGLMRVYQQKDKHLYAKWSWFTTRWGVHIPLPFGLFICPPPLWRFEYKKKVEVRGTDVAIIANDLPIGLAPIPVRARKLMNPAEAIILGKDHNYFAGAGTTVIGLARENKNPLNIFGESLNGIARAFGDGESASSRRTKWIFATSAARAGYNPNRYKDAAARKNALQGGRFQRYQLAYVAASGKNNWNFNQTDWAPMFVPVDKADAEAVAVTGETPGAFVSGGEVLKQMMTSKKNKWQMREKGRWQAAKDFDPEKLLPPKDDGFSSGQALDWDRLSDYARH